MPLVRIDLVQGKPADYRSAIGQAIYEAMRATLNVPENDNFQIITEHPPENLVADPNYLGISRSGDAIFIQITLNAGRTVEMKKAFYKAAADGIYEKAGIRREDIIINLTEVPKENWSFGNGIAQYA